ncbi:MAG: LacI family transcriptional regulator [Clostridiales bacterium]|nr:LacI family transcriptional regulator [Clostridiales bacterium]
MKDIAKYTGLSIATISKYINGGNVLEKNKILIDEAIKELNYQVNTMARGLKTNKSNTIGILIPKLEKIFCTSIVSNIEDILLQHGYSTMICDYKEDFPLEEEKLKFLVSKMVDGLIIMPHGKDGAIIQEAIDKGIKVVLIDRALDGVDCDVVLVDNMNSSYGAVEEFITKGHKRIGIINGPREVFTAKERLEGYYRVHRDYSIKVDEDLIKHGDFEIDSGYKLLIELIKMEEPPTAVYITNYEMTLGAIMAINEYNVNIPNQLSIIGYDNLQLARIIKPPLSIVVQPMKAIGETAANLLLKRLQGDMTNFPIRYRLKTELLIKDSVRKIES